MLEKLSQPLNELIMKNRFILFFALIAVLAASFSIFADDKLSAEEIIAKHLNSIGTAEIRNQTKSMIGVGDVAVIYISQKNMTSQGRIVMASAGEKNFMGMNLNGIDYPLEKFSFDGKKAKVAYVRPGVRSLLGNFVVTNGMLLQDSLLGGTLSTSWALLNLSGNKAKISSDGTKKIEGKETYILGYSTKGNNDFNIKLYFDKGNFQHLRTEYNKIFSAGIGTSPEQSSRFSESRLKITENFSDYKSQNGLNLPQNYTLNYSIIGQNGTTEIEWKFNFIQFAFNQKFDDKTFDAEAN